jgi:hypothetical protein
MNKYLKLLTLLLFAGIAALVPARAQELSSVHGVVIDSSGGLVSAVTVALDNPSLGLHFTTTSDDSGFYQFLRVPSSQAYSLTFSKDGFRKLTMKDVSLGANTAATRDARLEVGEVSQSVTVNSEQGLITLNTTDASISNQLDLKSVDALPSVFRNNAVLLMTLSAGVVGRSNGDLSQDGSITGSRADQASVTLDGMDVNDEAAGFGITSSISIPVDAIGEVKTTVGSGDATFGRSASGVGAFITRAGTNQWHGSANEYHRDRLFAANDFFNNKNSLPRPPLIRNQFGAALGGPILKDKLFFFFDYVGLRQSQAAQTEQVVPLDNVRNLANSADPTGGLAYINTNAGCNASARQTTAPQCISFLNFNALKNLDPAGIGPNINLLNFVNGRYPHANDLSAGDGINTGGFIFNSAAHRRQNTIVARLDYNFTDKQRFFARGTWDRFNDDQFNPLQGTVVQQFPGDPSPLIGFVNHTRSWVIGHTWTISPTLFNQANFGISTQLNAFPVRFTPTAPNVLSFNNGSGLANPFGTISSQARKVPIPELRDDLTKVVGKHTLQFGANLKWISSITDLTPDINIPLIGLGGFNTTLDRFLRPNVAGTPLILQDQAGAAIGEWDQLFPIVLGRFAQIITNYNYDLAGNVQPLFTNRHRNYRYNEYEIYGQDSWKIRNDLTLTLGLRWQLHSVPYEVNGFEAIPTVSGGAVLADRIAAAAAGISGNTAIPLTGFIPGGPKNNAPDFYNNDLKDFGPRLGISYAPSFREGLLHSIFGDRKTTIRAGGGIYYDRLLNTLTFELDQQTFLFDTQQQVNFGARTPEAALAGDPRFDSINNLLTAPTPAKLPRPNFPNLDAGGNPVGFFNGGFPAFFSFDRNLKTPRNYTVSFGIQRELPGNLLVEVNYFGRFARKLLAVGDAAQTLNFKDATTGGTFPGGQLLFDAFGKLQAQLQQQLATNGRIKFSTLTPQPWFENQVASALAAQGLSCESFAPTTVINSCTGLAAALAPNATANGDVSTLLVSLAQLVGGVNPNVGLYAQTGADGYLGNFGSSSYNGLLVSLHKRVSQNLQFDFHYTYSHSIDNVSDIQNTSNSFTFNGSNLVCSLVDLRLCRGDSNFDSRHLVSANYVYSLPIGRGQTLLRNAPRWLDYVVGGWGTSGIVTGYTGFPFSVRTGTFPIDFTQDAPAVFNGQRSALSPGIHTDSGGNIQFFADPNAAVNAFSFPFGGGTGNRNVVRGPAFVNVDMGLTKNFKMPWKESHVLQLRLEAFNVFNHVNYNTPTSASLANPGQFGIINGDFGPRTAQVALRYDF